MLALAAGGGATRPPESVSDDDDDMSGLTTKSLFALGMSSLTRSRDTTGKARRQANFGWEGFGVGDADAEPLVPTRVALPAEAEALPPPPGARPTTTVKERHAREYLTAWQAAHGGITPLVAVRGMLESARAEERRMGRRIQRLMQKIEARSRAPPAPLAPAVYPDTGIGDAIARDAPLARGAMPATLDISHALGEMDESWRDDVTVATWRTSGGVPMVPMGAPSLRYTASSEASSSGRSGASSSGRSGALAGLMLDAAPEDPRVHAGAVTSIMDAVARAKAKRREAITRQRSASGAGTTVGAAASSSAPPPSSPLAPEGEPAAAPPFPVFDSVFDGEHEQREEALHDRRAEMDEWESAGDARRPALDEVRNAVELSAAAAQRQPLVPNFRQQSLSRGGLGLETRARICPSADEYMRDMHHRRGGKPASSVLGLRPAGPPSTYQAWF